MDTNTHSKLIMAVVQEDDYDATVSQLNKNGFFVTMLSSTAVSGRKRTSPSCWACPPISWTRPWRF